MIAIRTKNLSPLFKDILGLGSFLESLPRISLVTSPSDGVDWELSGAIPEGTRVYSLIPHIKGARETIDSHRLALGVPLVIPLFPVSEDYPQGYGGLYGVTDPSEVENFRQKTGNLPEAIRVTINPLKYPKELLDYCREEGIKIIGSDIFGGELLGEYYKSIFPEAFLQAFGEHNSDIMEVPGVDPYFIKRVYQRKGSGEGEGKFLEYSKSIDKVPRLKEGTQKVFQTLDLEIPGVGRISVPGGDSGGFSLKKSPEVLDLGEPIWEDDLIPEDVDPTDKEFLGTLHRYHVLPELQEMYPGRRWKPIFTKILPDFWVIKIIPKGWFGWMWQEYLYYLISGKLWKIPLSAHESLKNVWTMIN